tara:strand:- start:1758 stop:2000 length:243 start_codon:yes stop_codon:yes gene_type:complete
MTEEKESAFTVTTYYKGEDVKIVWREEGKTKLGRGRIVNDDEQFIYLKGSKGLLVVNRSEVIVIKGQRKEEEKNADNASK